LSPRALVPGNLVLLALLAVHALDHSLRQEAPVPTEASTLGTVGFVSVAVALGLSLAGHRLARPATVLVGLGTAAGFVAVHVLPDWGPFSQPYADIDVDALSWVNMLVPALVALGAGLLALRGRAVAASSRA
jgi:hypothetical protein